jgi:plasmid stabilization system protein ParE
MYLLNFAKIIHEDIDSSYKYMAEKLGVLKAAENLIEEIIEKLNYIKETPYSRALVQDSYLASFGIRSIKVKNYIMYYNVDDDEQKINIIRLLYNKRHWIKLLKENIIKSSPSP